MRLLRPSRNRPFGDRTEAGRKLATTLAAMLEEAAGGDAIVLGLARGGVPVAAPIADRLGAELDVCVVRKIGAPTQPELAIGAIAPGNVRVLNRSLVRELGLSDATVERLTASAAHARDRVERGIRGDTPLPVLRGRVVILVDDGLATGASMQAAVVWAGASHPQRVIVAVPVAPPRLIDDFRRTNVDAVCILEPETFGSVGQFYSDFSEVSTEEVRELLEQRRVAWERRSPPSFM